MDRDCTSAKERTIWITSPVTEVDHIQVLRILIELNEIVFQPCIGIDYI
jgi:hypothetical protein